MLQTIAALGPLVPLIQTILWVSLILFLVLWLNKPIRQLLAAVRQRVETGSAVKAGWFELSELRTQPVEQQLLRTKEDAAEVARSTQENSEKDHGENAAPLKTSNILLAEDLALRALQADLGVPFNRQISLGPDTGVDAAFARNGKLNLIEVKFFPGPAEPRLVREALDRLSASVKALHWGNVQFIAILVFQHREDVYLPAVGFNDALRGMDIPVEIKTYALSELMSRFGVEDGDA
jgi:hypothetical protein